MDPSSFLQKLAPMGVRRDLRHGHGHFIGADNDVDLIAQTIARAIALAIATVRMASMQQSSMRLLLRRRGLEDVRVWLREDESRMQSHGMPHRFAALTQLTLGLAIVNPTRNVLPWNELFPADSQRYRKFTSPRVPPFWKTAIVTSGPMPNSRFLP